MGAPISTISTRPGQPDVLIEDYSRAMISALLFMAGPRSVLLIGLGGCSVVHFLRAAFPTCFINVVEIREAVIDLAHDFFLLPQGNPLLRVVVFLKGEG